MLSGIGLIVLLPIIIVVAFFIKFESKGPVFFRQVRIGKKEKTFKIYKFRTMKSINSDTSQLTTVRDQRITKVGHKLRKLKIDEIPQLINVLKGEMSFVGPRPEVARYVNCYNSVQRKVLFVTPGMTDLASLYYRDEKIKGITLEEIEEYYVENILPNKLLLNQQYILHRSFMFDFKLILQTVLSVLFPPYGKQLQIKIEKCYL